MWCSGDRLSLPRRQDRTLMCCPSPHKNQQSRQQRQNTHLMIDKAVIDHLPANIEDHHQSYIGDPTIAIDISRANIGSRSEEHTSELTSLMRNSYAVFCFKKNKNTKTTPTA